MDSGVGQGIRAALGKYDLIASLGHGGMADVYLAVHRGPSGFSKLVVIKSIRNFENGEQLRGMLLDEARIAARLQHPNIVQTLEVGDDTGRPFLAMEYLDGQPLNAIVAAAREKNEPLGPAFAAYVMREALAGLHYAHELKNYDGTSLGIVHRDVSPHNIVVTYEGEVKVVDFGIAKASTNVSKTEVGGVKGKIAYMAPEQARGEAIDRRVDIFGAGLVLWELLASRRMLVGETPVAILHALLNESLPRIAKAFPAVSPGLEQVVSRSLAKNRDERFQTAEEMLEALHPFSREVDRMDVGRKIRSMFESQRAEIQRQIRQAIQPVVDAPTVTTHRLVLPEIEMGTRGPYSGSGTPPPPQTTSVVTSPRSSLTLGGQGATKGSSPFVIVAGALVVVLVGVGVYGVRRTTGNGASTSAGPAFVVDVQSTPDDAVFELDGAAVGSGHLTKPLPRDGQKHVLRISAPAHETLLLEFDETHPPPGLVALRATAQPEAQPVASEVSAAAPAKSATKSTAAVAAPGTKPGVDIRLKR